MCFSFHVSVAEGAGVVRIAATCIGLAALLSLNSFTDCVIFCRLIYFVLSMPVQGCVLEHSFTILVEEKCLYLCNCFGSDLS